MEICVVKGLYNSFYLFDGEIVSKWFFWEGCYDNEDIVFFEVVI